MRCKAPATSERKRIRGTLEWEATTQSTKQITKGGPVTNLTARLSLNIEDYPFGRGLGSDEEGDNIK